MTTDFYPPLPKHTERPCFNLVRAMEALNLNCIFLEIEVRLAETELS